MKSEVLWGFPQIKSLNYETNLVTGALQVKRKSLGPLTFHDLSLRIRLYSVLK